MARHARITAASWVLLVTVPPALAGEVSLELDPGKVLNRIDEKVYGHFLEHIYHSVNGGLWGEMIWNRSFEENAAGQWRTDDGCVVQEGMGTNQRLVFGDPAWGDYEYTLGAFKTGGAEGFLVLFRVKSERDFYWCNLGGWGNRRHSLERGRSAEGRWHTVGPGVDGGIEANRWYRIRIRCEGPQIRVWLDDRLLIDFKDPEGHPTGAVGVGTWATQAKFRNLKVRAIEGKVLFEGLPKTLVRPSVALYWKVFGPGEAFLEAANPLNNRCCQRVAARSPETGLEQTPVCLRGGERYTGSIWVRGHAPEGLVVRLVDRGKTLSLQKLPAPEGTWKEYPFGLYADEDAPDATIQVAVRGDGEVWIDQVSMMPETSKKRGGFRPDLLKAIGDLRPPVIRWPGGCFASAYRWKDGIGPQHRRGVYPREIWDDLDVNSFGTDEFVAMCREVGAEPLIVVNIGTESWNGKVERSAFIQEVCDWIEYANGPADSKWGKVRAANGHPELYRVTYWEIDNETWHMGAESYARAVKDFAPVMKKVDPAIKLAACGSGGYGDGALKWNRTIIEQCADLIDYLSIHHYFSPNDFARGPYNYERFFHRTKEFIAASKNPDLKIYVSEWNVQSTDWRTGLFAGGLLNAFERCGDFLEVGGPALFLRHASATAWDNAFINFDHRTWFPAPNYVVMKLWRDHYAPERIVLEGEAGSLNAVATRSADGRRVHFKAVNPARETVSVKLNLPERLVIGRARMGLVAPGALDARNTLERPDTIEPELRDLTVDGQTVRLEMPPLSAGVVVIPVTRRSP